VNALNYKKNCHNCGDKINLFMVKVIKRTFCYYCMEYVCDKDCISDEKYVIPRGFNIDFDL
jgi:hypothetical protein